MSPMVLPGTAGNGPRTNDLLIAQRGPGELVGDMALFRKNKTRCATVRCCTDLTVRVILKVRRTACATSQRALHHAIGTSMKHATGQPETK